MDIQSEDLQKIVALITQKVKEKLSLETENSSVCTASSEQCAACGQCVSRRVDDTRKIIDLGAVRIGSSPTIGPVEKDLARYIDHTLLKPEATKDQLSKLCHEAKRYGFYSVCVNSANVRFCKALLKGTPVKVVAVVGFPLGAMSTGAKVCEAREAVSHGAEEIDMVINIGQLKSKNYAFVLDDIARVVNAVRPAKVKVIIETGSLTKAEKIIACALAKAAGAHFVKTSTGFGAGGATAEDVALMKEVVGQDVEVKASGGIRTKEAALKMIEAGATRIGASASVAIVTGNSSQKKTKIPVQAYKVVG